MAVFSTTEPLKKFLRDLARDLRPEDEARIRFLLVDQMNASSDIGALHLFAELEARGFLAADDLSFVSCLLGAILRTDLSRRVVDEYSRERIVMKGMRTTALQNVGSKP